MIFFTDNQPFKIVEDIGFLNFVFQLVPKDYKLPHRITITKLIANIKKEAIKKIITELEKIPNLAITSDGWRKRNGEDFISLFAHFIDEYLKSTHLY